MLPWLVYTLFWAGMLTNLLDVWCFRWGHKDGGPESKVRMWGIECKALGSILVLRVALGTRDVFHSHAFGSLSWVLTGALYERMLEGPSTWHWRRWRPVVTRRSTTHKVYGGFSRGSWVLSFRGPWADTWTEVVDDKLVRLTHERKVVAL